MQKMDRNIVKVYLTKIAGNNEEVLVGPVTIDSLEDSTLRNGALKLYSSVDKHTKNSSVAFTNYRLRIWIDASTELNLIQGREYKLLVNVDSKIQPAA